LEYRAIAFSEFIDGIAWRCERIEQCCDVCKRVGIRDQDSGVNDGQRIGGRIRDAVNEGINRMVNEEINRGMNERINKGVNERVNKQANEVEEFLEGLRQLNGRCMLCEILRRKDSSTHEFDRCTSRGWFFEAKKRANREVRGGWIAKYAGCYGCYMPQDLCSQQGQKVLGQWKCEFRDMLGPIN
jgi:hypothetical protein